MIWQGLVGLITLIVVFVAIPGIGSIVGDGGDNYWEDFVVGLVVVCLGLPALLAILVLVGKLVLKIAQLL